MVGRSLTPPSSCATAPGVYAAGTFALISVLFDLKDRLPGRPQYHHQRVAMRHAGALRVPEFDPSAMTRPVAAPGRRIDRRHRRRATQGL